MQRDSGCPRVGFAALASQSLEVMTHHNKGDCDTIAVADGRPILKPSHHRDGENHEDPVDPGDVDLSHNDVGGVDDVQAREAAERDRLLDY